MNFQKEIKKAYKKTPVWELDELLLEESKWKRKRTIASNKLEIVRLKINGFIKELAIKNVKGE